MVDNKKFMPLCCDGDIRTLDILLALLDHLGGSI